MIARPTEPSSGTLLFRVDGKPDLPLPCPNDGAPLSSSKDPIACPMEHRAENDRPTCFLIKTFKEAGQKRPLWADFFKQVSKYEKDGKLIIFSGEMSKKSRFEEIAPPARRDLLRQPSIGTATDPMRMWHLRVECETPWLALLVAGPGRWQGIVHVCVFVSRSQDDHR